MRRRRSQLSRRNFLKYCQGASFAFLPAGLSSPLYSFLPQGKGALPNELQVHPQYLLKRGFEGVLRKVPAGFDDFITEKYQDQVVAVLAEWSSKLQQYPQDVTALAQKISENFRGNSLKAGQLRVINEE